MSSNKLVASLRQELAEAQARIRYLEECDTMDDRSRSLRVFADHVEQVFWMADPAIRSMLYVSPSYERVWGRRCADLYLNPKSFLDSVHPEDLPNVLTVLRQQELGESFDHSYRIITPSGEVRWIRDRGRPVRNESAAIWCYIGIAEDVTDRRLADERVRFQARVLECVQESVIVTDTHGTVIYWNQGAEALYGWPTAEATGRPIYELTVPEELISQQRAEEIMAALARGDKWSGEFTVRRRDGTSFVAGVTNHPLLGESGELIGIIGVSVDITEHKRSEEFRAQNESLLEQRVADRTQEISNVRTRLELASDATRLGIWEWDLSTARATWNDHMFSIYGLSPSDFDGSVDSVMRNIHPEDKASLVTTLQTLADSGVAEKVTYRVLRGDGTTTHVRGQAIVAPGFPSRRLVGTALDISAEVDTLQRLTENSMQNLLLFEESPVPSFFVSARGELIRANKACTSLLKLLPLQPPGDSADISCLLGPDWMTRLLGSPTADVPATQTVGEFRTALSDGQHIHLEARLFPVLFEGQPHYLGALTDITARRATEMLTKETEEHLRLANQELSRITRLKDELLCSISHELRTPLSSILGIAELLVDGVHGPLSTAQINDLNSLTAAATHLRQIIDDLLDLSKIESGQTRLFIDAVHASDICEATLNLARLFAAQKRITLSFSVEDSTAAIWTDQQQIIQALLNLLSNAVKFSPAGSAIALEVSPGVARHSVRFSVIDADIGIQPEQLKTLFQPFVQVDGGLSRREGGTGLGLWLVRRIAEACGGSVGCSSSPGVGSRFWLELPADLRPEQSDAPSTGVPTDTSGLTVLVAEHALSSQTSLAGLARSAGFHCVTAQDGIQAIDLAIEHRPDLIVIDTQLPLLQRDELLKRLRRIPETTTLPVLLVESVFLPDVREPQRYDQSPVFYRPLSAPALRRAILERLGPPCSSSWLDPMWRMI